MKHHLSRGFTLIELMVIILIIGLLAGFVAPNVFQVGESAKIKTAGIQIKALLVNLDRYRLDNNTFPSTEQGLRALIEKPTVPPIPTSWAKGGYIRGKSIPKDPWSREYQYLNSNGTIFLYSQGPNKDSDDDDIGNKATQE